MAAGTGNGGVNLRLCLCSKQMYRGRQPGGRVGLVALENHGQVDYKRARQVLRGGTHCNDAGRWIGLEIEPT